jgi:hypothetical protein
MTSRLLVAVLGVLFGISVTQAQVSLTGFNAPYTQDFDSLISSGSTTWVDNSTLTGCYHYRTGSNSTIIAGTGSSNTGALYSFGLSPATDRALGSVGSGTVGDLYWGVRIVNMTGSTIDSLRITYTGEEWRYSGTAAAQTVEFHYQTGTALTSLNSGTWTPVPALDFTSPVYGGTTGALDGNDPANRTTIMATITGLSLAAGDEIMLRWFDPNHSGSDHGLSIDDLSVVAPVPVNVSITALNTPYTQNFDGLITSGSSSWVDDATIPGWFHDRTGYGDLIVANSGSSNSGALYSYGTGTSTDRALGSVGSGNAAVGDLYWGVRLANNTGVTITALAVSYYGEQWRYSGTAAAQTVEFHYMTGSGLDTLMGGSWTAVPLLDFTSPVYGGSTGALDGNNSANRTLVSGIIPVSIPPGGEIMLRWFDPNHSGSDHGLAIDDFSVTAYGSSGPTAVKFATAASAFPESAGTVQVSVEITNPDPVNATTVDVVLTGGTATNGVDISPAYSTQTLIFPAGSSAAQSISLSIVDNTTFQGDRYFEFSLQNVQGGNSASAGSPATHTFTILENDSPPAPDVVVNEYLNAYQEISTDESIELLVVTDGLDMRGWSVSDATSGGTFPWATLTFSNDPLWADLPAGTIIVIGGIYSVPIQDLDVSDGLLKVQAPSSGNSNTYFSANSNSFAIAGSSDAVAVFDASSSFVHGLAHGSGNQSTLPAGRHGWLNSSISSGDACFFTRTGGAMTTTDFLADTYVAEGTGSIGAANDTDGNLAYLRSIRSRTITGAYSLSGSFYWNVTVNGGSATQSGSVNIGNTLAVLEGGYDDSGFALTLDGSGNAQNGSGAGNILVGDDAGSGAFLVLRGTLAVISGSLDADGTEATVQYAAPLAQSLLPAVYNNLRISSGSATEVKTAVAGITVHGALSIDAGSWLIVPEGLWITLGSSGTYVNAGRFIGDIRSTRPVSTYGVTENFGGIGFSITVPAVPAGTTLPGNVTVTMTSGRYTWVDNLPSIPRSYAVQSTQTCDEVLGLTIGYDQNDLNGQNESALALQYSNDGGVNWMQPGGALNTTSNTIALQSAVPTGLWTMHASPPQGTITSAPIALSFAAEELGSLPAMQNVSIANANAGGSIIEWSAAAASATVPGWLSIVPEPSAGVNAGMFSVAVTRTDLAPGTYQGTITVSDPHATNHPYVIPVSYRVYAQRRICLGTETDTLRIKVSYKKTNATTSIPVLNCGESFGPGVIAWSASTSTPWLTITSGNGLEGEGLGLYVDALLMPYGTYYGSITISGVNSVTSAPIINSPLTVVVALEVEPRTEATAQAAALSAGNSATLYNAEGQRVARVTVRSGSITTLSVRLVPFGLPRNINRLRYAYRYYDIEASGSYSADITMYYTLQELAMTGITDASLLRPWVQRPDLVGWVQQAGYASAVEQSVTATGVADLNGNWGMAMPYLYIPVNVHARGSWVDSDLAELRWDSDIVPTGAGWVVERSASGRDRWEIAGFATEPVNGTWTFGDRVSSATDWQYRLTAYQDDGTAFVSDPVGLEAQVILSAEGAGTANGYALMQNAPNPVPSALGSTGVEFRLGESGVVRLALFDSRGREVAELASGFMEAGVHNIRIGTSRLAPGTYFYRLETSAGALVRKLSVVR